MWYNFDHCSYISVHKNINATILFNQNFIFKIRVRTLHTGMHNSTKLKMDSTEVFKPVKMLDINCRVSGTILITVWYNFDQIHFPQRKIFFFFKPPIQVLR